MKDKLRELAEMVREAYRAGFIAACKWPSPVTQDVDSSAYTREFNNWSFSVREKHAAILDAEGDGGAVELEYPEFHVQGMGCGLEDRGITDRYEAMRYGFDEALDQMARIIENAGPIYTHPARSGVVSDEDVSVVAKMIADRFGNVMRERYEGLAKQIVEHLTKRRTP